MTTALLVAAVLVAVAACPLMMWWSARRGRASACCIPEMAPPRSVDELRQRHAELEARIAALGDQAGRAS